MMLNDLNEPDLENPQVFMYETFMIAQEMYGNHTRIHPMFGGYTNSLPYMLHDPIMPIKKIFINADCMKSKESMAFQLSHEVFHALMPLSAKFSTILEEGIATDFSLIVINHLGYSTDSFFINNCSYRYAVDLVRSTGINDPSIIKKIREIQPTISNVKSHEIQNIMKIDQKHLELLLSNFSSLTKFEKIS